MSARRPMTLASWLLLGQVGVLVAMAATVVGVALVVGPPAFDTHLSMAGLTDPEVLLHADEAFQSAGLTAMAAGLFIAVVGAIVASVLLTMRFRAALAALAEGAARVADGDPEARVVLPVADRELTSVAASFNAMAERIAATEATRRRMLTDVSHELRTPLAAIDLVLEGVEDGVVPTDAATLATLRAQTARLARLARDIRDVSAAEEGRLVPHREPVALADLVGAALATGRPLADARGVRLVAGDVAGVTVEADRALVGQVLDNLVRNAVQHTPAGGTVELWADASDAGVRLGVRDDGAGIAAADLPHVFERFFRGGTRRHDEGAGTGVGLAISRAIALAHGGTLTASSDGEGRGAELVLALPR